MSAERPPSIYDLIAHAQPNERYNRVPKFLIPTDYERSIDHHKRFGTPTLQRLFMKVGRRTPGSCLDPSAKSRLEAVVDFAFKQTVVNEKLGLLTLAAGGALGGVSAVGAAEAQGGGAEVVAVGAMTLGFVAVKSGLVAIQRYNRARLMRVADRLLQRGDQFDPGYTNSYGVDARAMKAYVMEQGAEAAITAEPALPAPTPMPGILDSGPTGPEQQLTPESS